MRKDVPQPDGSVPEKPSLLQSIGATVLGIVAAKLATNLATAIWRLITREDVPKIHQGVSAIKKALWLALSGVISGSARQAVRDIIKPTTAGPA